MSEPKKHGYKAIRPVGERMQQTGPRYKAECVCGWSTGQCVSVLIALRALGRHTGAGKP